MTITSFIELSPPLTMDSFAPPPPPPPGPSGGSSGVYVAFGPASGLGFEQATSAYGFVYVFII